MQGIPKTRTQRNHPQSQSYPSCYGGVTNPYRGDPCSTSYKPTTRANWGGNTGGESAEVCDPRGQYVWVPQQGVYPGSGEAQKEDIGLRSKHSVFNTPGSE